jgi:hypothetical protein
MPFSPANLSSAVWLKADAGAYKDAGVTLAADGESVQRWADQSGHANHANQATAGFRPVYRATALNGLPGLQFDDADDFLQLTAPLANPSQSVFCVARFDNPGADANSYLIGRSDNSPTTVWGFDDDAQGMRLLSTSSNYFGGLKRTDVRGSTKIFELSITANTATLFVNGVQQGTPGTIVTDFTANLIGAYTGGRNFGGLMGELLAFPAVLNAAAAKNIRKYLNRKWGLYPGSTAFARSCVFAR